MCSNYEGRCVHYLYIQHFLITLQAMFCLISLFLLQLALSYGCWFWFSRMYFGMWANILYLHNDPHATHCYCFYWYNVCIFFLWCICVVCIHGENPDMRPKEKHPVHGNHTPQPNTGNQLLNAVVESQCSTIVTKPTGLPYWVA